VEKVGADVMDFLQKNGKDLGAFKEGDLLQYKGKDSVSPEEMGAFMYAASAGVSISDPSMGAVKNQEVQMEKAGLLTAPDKSDPFGAALDGANNFMTAQNAMQQADTKYLSVSFAAASNPPNSLSDAQLQTAAALTTKIEQDTANPGGAKQTTVLVYQAALKM